MAAGYLDVIKGNEGEIKTVYGDTGTQQRGVDSTSTLDIGAKVALVQELARREKNVVVMTGKADIASDGERTFIIENGHEYLGMVTGTGCCLGTTISAMVAAHPQDKLVAAVAGILLFEIAAEEAVDLRDGGSQEQMLVRGPGTFVPNFIDELRRLRLAMAHGNDHWRQRARVSVP